MADEGFETRRENGSRGQGGGCNRKTGGGRLRDRGRQRRFVRPPLDKREVEEDEAAQEGLALRGRRSESRSRGTGNPCQRCGERIHNRLSAHSRRHRRKRVSSQNRRRREAHLQEEGRGEGEGDKVTGDEKSLLTALYLFFK